MYGDSSTSTHAYGEIGSDSVNLAGLQAQHQFFAAINDTNTSVIETGSTGIFGIGFPINSIIWKELYTSTLAQSTASKRDLRTYPRRRGYGVSYRRPTFPDIPSLYPKSSLTSRQTDSATIAAGTSRILSSFASFGPLIPRLSLSSTSTAQSLTSPMVSITLQRNSISPGSGAAGILSLGSLPPGISNDSLTYVPLRAYTPAQGGLPGPTGNEDEAFPITWEVFLDDVFLDGVVLPRSNLSSSTIKLSALVDTGNSLLRGPADVVSAIYTSLSGGSVGGSPVSETFSCSTPHTLSFSIGGKLFPVDPRDFIRQAFVGDASRCTANLVSTDAPVEGKGYLYSWSLGDPFLKG